MSNAVYLIVAGVLLGPIEAQPQQFISDVEIGTHVVDNYRQCLQDAGKPIGTAGSHNSHCLSLADALTPHESTSETCERAMKEMGLKLVQAGRMADGSLMISDRKSVV